MKRKTILAAMKAYVKGTLDNTPTDLISIGSESSIDKETGEVINFIKAEKIFLSMILQANQMHGFKSEYLMLTKDGNRMNNDAINNVLRRLNCMLKTPQKGNHSIRKTCISNMGASKALTNEEVCF